MLTYQLTRSPFFQYRSIMRDCQQQLDAEAEIETAAAPAASASATPPAKADFYVQQSELMYKLELIWNLVEIVCIEKPPNGMILPQLLQWISLHFPRAEELTRDVLSEHPESPEVGPEYWDAITLFVLQGRTDQAQKLLRLHSEFGSESFVSLDELLRKMPVYPGGVGGGAGAAGMSSVDFDFRWKHWQREVNARIDEGDFAGDVNLNRLAAVLAGSEQVFNTELVEQCESWYQWMIGKIWSHMVIAGHMRQHLVTSTEFPIPSCVEIFRLSFRELSEQRFLARSDPKNNNKHSSEHAINLPTNTGIACPKTKHDEISRTMGWETLY